MVKLRYKGVKFQIAPAPDISGIVLAGGKGTRLGHDKIFEIIGNKSLLQRVVSVISRLCHEVIIVTSPERNIPQVISDSNLKIVGDILPGKGPLIGIYTGLKVSNSFYNLVVASDMPFLKLALLQCMAQVAGSYDVVVPRVGSLVEPLHAIYSKNCVAAIENMMKLGKLSVYRLLELVKVRYVQADEIERFDPKHLSFFNINTKADLNKARKLASHD